MKERIEYIIDNTDGKEIFVGRSVNYNVVAQAATLDRLEHKMKIMVNAYLKFGNEIMEQSEPVELKEITKEEWSSQYAEWMKTSKWMNIADALYDTLRDLVGDKWTNDAAVKYEENRTRKKVK
jgi:kynureninase